MTLNDSMAVPSAYVNKLYGISSTMNPHKRSIRLGWRFNAETLLFDLYLYTYKDGHRDIRPAVSVPVGTELAFSFINDGEDMEMVVYDITSGDAIITSSMKRKKNGKKAFLPAVLTHPYWGGIEQAPQRMSFIAEGIEKAKWIQNLEVLFSVGPTLTSLVLGIILLFTFIVLGKISVALMMIVFFLPALYYLIFIDQWLYIKISSLFRRLHLNG